MSWVATAVAGAAIIGGTVGAATTGKKKVKNQLKKMPKYGIHDEAYQNQSLARSRAFGRDRSVQIAQEDIESQGANDIALAQDTTDSTSALLSTLASINANTTKNKRDLAGTEVAIQKDNVADLYAMNNAMIDEKDKEWRQNKYAPWEAKLRAIQGDQAANRQLFSNIVGAGLSFFGAGGGGKMGGGGGGGNPANL